MFQNPLRKHYLNAENPCPPPQLGLCPGPAWDLKRISRSLAAFLPPNIKSWIYPCKKHLALSAQRLNYLFIDFTTVEKGMGFMVAH